MSHAFSTTRYFAVGFFTAAQLEKKHRAMLARAAANTDPVPTIQTAISSVDVTIFGRDNGTDSVDVFLSTVGATRGNNEGSFVVEPFDGNVFPPAGVTAQSAFEAYLASSEGQQAFGEATAVQLLSMSVDAAADSPAYWMAPGAGRANERAN